MAPPDISASQKNVNDVIAKLSAANLKAAFVQGFFLLCVGLEHGLVEVDEAVSELGHRVQRVRFGLEPDMKKSERSIARETAGGGTKSLIEV